MASPIKLPPIPTPNMAPTPSVPLILGVALGKLVVQIGAAYALNLGFAKLVDRAITKNAGYLQRHSLFINSAAGLLSSGGNQLISLVVIVVLALGGRAKLSEAMPEVFQRLLICGSLYWQFNHLLSRLPCEANIKTPQDAKDVLLGLGAREIKPSADLCFNDRNTLRNVYITLHKRNPRGLIVSSPSRAYALMGQIASEIAYSQDTMFLKDLVGPLKGKEIIQLDLRAHAARGSEFAGQVELLIAAMKASRGKLIVYIPDLYAALGQTDYSDPVGTSILHTFGSRLSQLLREHPEICILGSISSEEQSSLTPGNSEAYNLFDFISVNPIQKEEVIDCMKLERKRSYSKEIFSDNALEQIYAAASSLPGENPHKALNLMDRVDKELKAGEVVWVEKGEEPHFERRALSFEKALEKAKLPMPTHDRHFYT